MTGYTKLFGSIIGSTIWRESKDTKIVWITMLAMANKFGIVEASVPGLADFARVTLPECEAALAVLLAPDPYSRTKDFEGRRIEPVDGGWRLLNHAKYRAKMSADDRREYLRLKQREHRELEKRQHGVNKCQQKSTPSTHAEAQSKAIRHSPPTPSPSSAPRRTEGVCVPRNGELGTDGFEAFERFWTAYPKKTARFDAEHAFSEVGALRHIDAILTAIKGQQRTEEWRKERGRYIPAPAKWLRDGRWQDQGAPDPAIAAEMRRLDAL